MARITNPNSTSHSSSMAIRRHANRVTPAARVASSTNIRASAYVVNAATAALKGLHYSSTSGTGVGSGIPSPPESPPLAAQTCELEERDSASLSSRRSGDTNGTGKVGAARKITEECERLFCDDLDDVFHGERKASMPGSLVIGAQNISDWNLAGLGATPPDDDDDGLHKLDHFASVHGGRVLEWLEIWDYAGDARFRGFTAAGPNGGKSMFVFFDNECLGKELKQGLMALLELATTPSLDCTDVIVCINRDDTSPPEARSLVRDLGWVGFEAVTLEQWTASGLPLTSRRWFFMGIDV